ncbi:protein-methionine-sulfoxide reductase heme-binding subunit MsrQ, partial [Pseudomonas sp. RIT-PI-AD]|uniref:protein-methionine-sulfoxide reductase heme-binding subunit MsrQ n=1 Tax=Pseudomonas sp. RIT-PI-AD TaxID=3035294 RepID=UPI0021DA8254
MRYRALRVLVFLGACLPLAIWVYQGLGDGLGADPGKTLVDRLGVTALIFLLITLAMTPLRALSGWGGWIALRRQLGLWSFAYAFLHVAGYAFFLLALDTGQLLKDLSERPYIIVGALAWSCLFCLALTSNRFSIRRLGKRWKRLHRLIYPAVGLALLHMLWIVRSDLGEWTLYTAIATALLLVRFPPLATALERHAKRRHSTISKKVE